LHLLESRCEIESEKCCQICPANITNAFGFLH
jgi:hypothetical protein